MTFWEPLVGWRAERTTQDVALAEITHHFIDGGHVSP